MADKKGTHVMLINGNNLALLYLIERKSNFLNYENKTK